MSIAVVTGAAGLIGSEAVKYFYQKGLEVIGIDNDMRKYFFGEEGSTLWNQKKLENTLPNYEHFSLDIRDKEGIFKFFKKLGKNISVVIHTAAQPSHDWAAKEPFTDFSINAVGTLNLLEATRQFCPDAPFIFTSTNKVYGDLPNSLPLKELDLRFEVSREHSFFGKGIDESFSIDQSKHSLFGASKVAADILAQEYGRYFGLKTGIFRGGCLTGPAHSGAELHGFLAYLVKCVVNGNPYTIFGYKGKQVRDNIHSYDLVSAFWHFFEKPRMGEVYNIGGGTFSNCSILEAIQKIENLTQRKLNYTLSDKERSGDHIWWVSDISKFKSHYPTWDLTFNLDQILSDIVSAINERGKHASIPSNTGV